MRYLVRLDMSQEDLEHYYRLNFWPDDCGRRSTCKLTEDWTLVATEGMPGVAITGPDEADPIQTAWQVGRQLSIPPWAFTPWTGYAQPAGEVTP